MASFPTIRPVTQQQMLTFRQAWSGVTAILAIDPAILPCNNHVKSAPFEMLVAAFPEVDWAQPRGNRRAILFTRTYMMPQFAQSLATKMGCAAEEGLRLPTAFLEEAKRPPPVYFESKEV